MFLQIFVIMKSLSILLLHTVITLSSGLYFHIGETEKKCFIEEIPDETMVVGEYPSCEFFTGSRFAKIFNLAMLVTDAVRFQKIKI